MYAGEHTRLGLLTETLQGAETDPTEPGPRNAASTANHLPSVYW